LTRSSSRRCPSARRDGLRRDLIRQVEALGLPVTAIVPTGAQRSEENKIARAFDLGRFSGGG
jgi:hypothetical protein